MRFLRATIGLLASSVAAQQPFPVVLTIDVDNAVLYRSDIADPARRGADASVTTPAAARAFTDILYIGDVVAVNGMPAKGLWTSRQYMMNFSPTPAAGFAVADVNRDKNGEVLAGFQSGAPQMAAYDGRDLKHGTLTQLWNGLYGDTWRTSGLRMAVRDLDRDCLAPDLDSALGQRTRGTALPAPGEPEQRGGRERRERRLRRARIADHPAPGP